MQDEAMWYGAVILLLFLIFVAKCFRIVKNDERAVVMRLGRVTSDFSAPLQPGLTWIWWPIETLLRWKVFIGQQDVIGTEGQAIDDLSPEKKGLSNSAVSGGATSQIVKSRTGRT